MTYANILVLISLLLNLGVLSDGKVANSLNAQEVRMALAASPAFQTSTTTSAFVKRADTEKKLIEKDADGVFTVPYYSQLTDISSPKWQKIGCGIASLAMLVDFYNAESVDVDVLLQEGISAGAYLTNAGWTYAGLIDVSHKHGLTGVSHDLAGSTLDTAFAEFTKALKKGPVMASVHYTFQPTNPIPHLVIVTGVNGDRLYYNDPAMGKAGDSIPVSQFKSSWKKRYIEFWPIS